MAPRDVHGWRRHIYVLRRKAGAGNVAAMYELGLLLQEGIQDRRGRAMFRRNPRAGFRLLLSAATRSDRDAASRLGYAYDVGLGTRRDRREAIRWYRRAWRGGHATAAYNLGTIHRDARRFRLMVAWWKRAVELKDGDAAVDVGYCYQYGIGTRRSVATARRLYRRAIVAKYISEAGREEAMYHLALTHIDDAASRLAIPLLARAAADGDYPEAASVLRQVRAGRTVVPCRCRRSISRRLLAHAACPRHTSASRPQ